MRVFLKLHYTLYNIALHLVFLMELLFILGDILYAQAYEGKYAKILLCVAMSSPK